MLYGSDFIFYFQPLWSFVRDHLNQTGNLPFWNPYLFSGTPLIGNIQACLFYPLGFLYYLALPETAYCYSTMMHMALGSGFMFLFMRSVGVKPIASLLSSLVFTFNGYFMGHLYAGHLSFVQNYIWIPLILLLLKRFVERASFLDAAAAGFFLGVQILGGFPQISFYSIMAFSLFVLVWGGLAWIGREKLSLLRLGTGWGIFIFLGFALAAVQLLPTYEFSKLSTRGQGISYAMATYESLHPKELFAFLLPDIFGNPIDGTYWRSREFWHFWESCGYVGIFPLFLLFVRGRGHELIKVRVFAVILVLSALFLALGKYNPLYPLIYRLPGFSSFRIPAQIIFLYVVAVAVLSGLGLNQVLEGEWRVTKGFWVFSVLSGLLLAAALIGLVFFRFEFFLTLFNNFAENPVTGANPSLLYERISNTIYKSCFIFSISFFLIVTAKCRKVGASLFSILACGIIFVDLYTFVGPFVRSYEFIEPPEKKSLLLQLSKTPPTGRVVTLDRDFRPNDGMMYRFPSIQGYDPLILKKYVDYVMTSQGYKPNEHMVNLYTLSAPEAKLIKLLHARQVISEDQVKELDNEIPYAFLVPDGTVRSEESILPFMISDEFNPRKIVVFSKPPKQGRGRPEQAPAFDGSCQVLRYRSEEIRFRVSCNRPAYLVMSEIWYPGWIASMDGKEVEVICGNYLFRVVPVDKGNHEVTLYFVSRPFRVGCVISLLTLVISLGLLWSLRRRRRGAQG
jgi:hypothetical protein